MLIDYVGRALPSSGLLAGELLTNTNSLFPPLKSIKSQWEGQTQVGFKSTQVSWIYRESDNPLC